MIILPGRRIACDRVLAFFARPMQPASELLQDHRLSLALRTAAAFLFGTAFLWPDLSDAATIRLFAAYTFIDGILALSPGGWGMAFRLGWPLLIGGVIDLAGSGIAYVWPDMTLPALAMLPPDGRSRVRSRSWPRIRRCTVPTEASCFCSARSRR